VLETAAGCEILRIDTAPGEVAFRVHIDGAERDVWIRADVDVPLAPEAALATCLIPAMSLGATLQLSAPVSPRLLRTQREFQAIQAFWSRGWDYEQPPLQEVEVVAPVAVPAAPASGRGVAAFFSGGVDSWSTVLDNPDLTHLIFARGLDLLPGTETLAAEVEARLREAAHELGLPLVVVETNLRELSDPLVRWDCYYGSALAAIALALAPCFERVLMTGWTDYATLDAMASNPLVDHLWSTEQLELVHAGARRSRMDRLALISRHPVVRRSLRVCWQNPGGAYNCGRCRKCLLTMCGLEALGVRERVTSFPAELDLGGITRFDLVAETSIVLWQDVLDSARAGGHTGLPVALEPVLARARAALRFPDVPLREPSAMRVAAHEALERAKAAEAELALERARAERLALALERIEASRSWALTRPMRSLARRLRGA